MIFTAIPKMLRGLPSTSTLQSGDSVNLTCEASGDPLPLYRWYKSGQIIQDTRLLINRNQTLQLTNLSPQDDGEYRCEAYNVEGTDSSLTNLRVHSK